MIIIYFRKEDDIMRVAMPMEEGYVSEHFGRARYFVIADIEEGKVKSKEIVENPVYESHRPGAVPSFLLKKGVQCIICGGMGPSAEEIFRRKGIEVMMGISGNVDEVLEKLAKGGLEGGENLGKVCERLHKKTASLQGNIICITAKGDNLDAEIDPRFGRCQYFILYDLESDEFEAIKNEGSGDTCGGGFGMRAADFLISQGVKAVITDEVGAGPQEKLQNKGIKVITSLSGIVKEAVEKFKKGEI
jgi:predicted Fe-Mo cluster-binding NifX family protein